MLQCKYIRARKASHRVHQRENIRLRLRRVAECHIIKRLEVPVCCADDPFWRLAGILHLVWPLGVDLYFRVVNAKRLAAHRTFGGLWARRGKREAKPPPENPSYGYGKRLQFT